jgi:hypothetical protein
MFQFSFSEKDVFKCNNNEYLCLDNNGSMYIRNFCTALAPVDIDNYFEESELKEYNQNIIQNKDLLGSSLNLDRYKYHDSVTVLGSAKKDAKLKPGSLVIGINESLREYSEFIQIYMSSSPYPKILDFCEGIKAWPEGVFSFRTNPSFVRFWKGIKHGFNTPKTLKGNSLLTFSRYNTHLEDHRSILLSALHLVYLLGIREIFLVGCENYLEEERPGAIYIKDGMWMFPQQMMDTSILAAASYWLSKAGIKTFTLDPNFDVISTIKFKEDVND